MRQLNLSQVIDNHCELLNWKSDIGYVVACEGTKRTAYMNCEVVQYHSYKDFTYDEHEAMIFQNKQDAANIMVDLKDTGLWKFLRIIPLANVWYMKGGKLPTVNGY